MSDQQQNPFGRKRDEIPTAEELMESFKGRVMPSNIDAEKSVIGYGLSDHSWFASRLSRMSPDQFYNDGLKTIFIAAQRRMLADKPLDAIILTNILRDEGTLDQVGGPSVIMEAFTMCSSSHLADYHLSQLTVLASQRRAVHAYSRGLDSILSAKLEIEGDVSNALESAKGLIEDASHAPTMRLKRRHIKDIIPEIYDEITERAQNPGKLAGWTTGIQTIDKRTGGMQKGQVWVIAGAPGDGKSTLMQNFAESAADAGAKILWYPLEMPDTEQVFRLLSSASQVDNTELFSGVMSRHQMDALASAQRRLCSFGIEVAEVENATATDILTDIEHSDCDIAVVDYLQLMDEQGGKNTTREQIIASISRRVKRLAKRTGKIIITGSQLNDDGRLRESRAIGQDADKVFIINKHPLEDGDKGETDDLKRLLWCDKNRGGKRFWEQPLKFLGHIFQFRELF